MQGLSGRLREVVAYKNRTTGGLFREEVQTHLLYGRYLLHAISKLRHVSPKVFVHKLVAGAGVLDWWSLTRGGRTWRFDCC